MKPGRKSLAAMLLLLVISAAVVWFGMGDEMKGARDMRFGIDIRGGVEAVFEPVGLDRAPTEAEVTAARNIMESRLDDRNILDREVTADTDRGYVIVRFPWKSGETQFNPEVAIAELGEMANLTFRDEAGTIMLEGKDVSTSSPVESGGNGPRQYAVELHFTEEGAEKFADATGKLTGQRMGIFMDDTIISNPVTGLQAETLLLTEWKAMSRRRSCRIKSMQALFPTPWQRGISAQSALPWEPRLWISWWRQGLGHLF